MAKIFDRAHYFHAEQLTKQVQENPTIWPRIRALLDASELPTDLIIEPRPFFKKAHFGTDETLVYQVGRALFPNTDDSETRAPREMILALLPAIVAEKG